MAMRRTRRASGRGSGSINVSFEIDPSPRALGERYEFLKSELRDMRPAWMRLVEKLRPIAGSQVTTGGARALIAWPPWKPSYARRRGTGAMLVVTGRLLSALTTKGKLSLTKSKLRFGVRLPYARAVYFGSKKKGIGPRPFLVATPEVIKHASDEANRRVGEILDAFPIQTGRGRAAAIIAGKQR